MSPYVAAIMYAHMPEPWVSRAKFVGRNYELLNDALDGALGEEEHDPDDE